MSSVMKARCTVLYFCANFTSRSFQASSAVTSDGLMSEAGLGGISSLRLLILAGPQEAPAVPLLS